MQSSLGKRRKKGKLTEWNLEFDLRREDFIEEINWKKICGIFFVCLFWFGYEEQYAILSK